MQRDNGDGTGTDTSTLTAILVLANFPGISPLMVAITPSSEQNISILQACGIRFSAQKYIGWEVGATWYFVVGQRNRLIVYFSPWVFRLRKCNRRKTRPLLFFWSADWWYLIRKFCLVAARTADGNFSRVSDDLWIIFFHNKFL